MGTRLVFSFRRTSLATSKPFMSGRLRSRRITSGASGFDLLQCVPARMLENGWSCSRKLFLNSPVLRCCESNEVFETNDKRVQLDICDPFGFGLRQRSRRTPDSRDHPRRRDFFSYHEAYTEAPIVGGNRIEVLLNGDETFSSMLREIRSAQSTITFAQYFYEGPVVKFLQAAFAESWLETTGIVIGGNGYFPRLEPVGNLPAQIVRSSPAGGSFQNYMLFLLSINSAKKSIFITNPTSSRMT